MDRGERYHAVPVVARRDARAIGPIATAKDGRIMGPTGMKNPNRHLLATLSVVLGLVVLTASAIVAQRASGSAAAKASWTQPRMPWGDPDLEGVWTSDNNFSIPLERPVAFASKEFLEGKDLEDELARRARRIEGVRVGGEVGSGPPHWYENLAAKSQRSSLIIDPPDGRLPALTDEGKRRVAAADAYRKSRGPSDSWEDRSLWDRCITVGLPAVMVPTGYNNNVQILQAPGYVTITHEMMHDARIIPLDGRPHVSSRIRGYYGDSRAHWEGTTLVVDVTNFNRKVNLGHMSSNRPTGENFHIIERYKRVGPDEVRYEVTIDDPTMYVRPWTIVLDLAAQKEMYEYACHEGNRGLENILRAARLDEAAGVKPAQ